MRTRLEDGRTEGRDKRRGIAGTFTQVADYAQEERSFERRLKFKIRTRTAIRYNRRFKRT